MSDLRLEGFVENGRIRLRDGVTLPENTRVYVIVPAAGPTPRAYIHMPRLAHPEQAADFAKQIIKATDDAGL